MSIRADRIRKLRENRGWTQQVLAEKCGVSKIQIHRYETGLNDPTSDTLRYIADIFGVTTDYLMGRIDSAAPYGLGSDGLSADEHAILETYRREGWRGVFRLGAERIAQ